MGEPGTTVPNKFSVLSRPWIVLLTDEETLPWQGPAVAVRPAVGPEGGVRDPRPTIAGGRVGDLRPTAKRNEDYVGHLEQSVIVDDYDNVAACRQAVHDSRARRAINDPIRPIDWAGIYWRRS